MFEMEEFYWLGSIYKGSTKHQLIINYEIIKETWDVCKPNQLLVRPKLLRINEAPNKSQKTSRESFPIKIYKKIARNN